MPAIALRFIIMTLIVVNFAILFSALARQAPSASLRATAAAPFCSDGRNGSCTSWL